MCGITSSTHTLIITSIKEIQTLNGITSAKINITISIYPIISLGYTLLIHQLYWLEQHFSSDLEEAMTESGKSLSNSKNYCSVFEKISKINDVKQNEKHPFTFNIRIWKGKCWILIGDGKNLNIKMADFENHRRFSLRCLSKGLIPNQCEAQDQYQDPKKLSIL